jgi:hypothetical protein
MANTTAQFFLNIPSKKFERIYRGTAKSVVVEMDNGVVIEFPAHELISYVTSIGIYGWFEIIFDESDKMLSFKSINDPRIK